MLRRAWRIGDRELIQHVERGDMPLDIILTGRERMRSPERTEQLLQLFQQCMEIGELRGAWVRHTRAKASLGCHPSGQSFRGCTTQRASFFAKSARALLTLVLKSGSYHRPHRT